MIIRGGANVSPAEVEAVLGGHPDVREVAVVGIPDPAVRRGGRRGRRARAVRHARRAALSAHCADRIAGYKVPSRFVVVEQLPRNPHTGKVQRADVVALVAAVSGAAAP